MMRVWSKMTRTCRGGRGGHRVEGGVRHAREGGGGGWGAQIARESWREGGREAAGCMLRVDGAPTHTGVSVAAQRAAKKRGARPISAMPRS